MNGRERPWICTPHGNIYIYIPNLIGYFRIASAMIAFTVARTNPIIFVIFYMIGFVCDELDGRFARLYNQTSQLGAVLDMVTDRLSTAGLLVILCMLYQETYVIFLGLLILDIFSHWCHMYYSLTSGSESHKDTRTKSWLVRTYYRYRWFMGVCCVSCEVLYLVLYLLHGCKDRSASRYVLVCCAALCTPGFISKQVINVVQLRNALSGIVDEEQKRSKAR